MPRVPSLVHPPTVRPDGPQGRYECEIGPPDCGSFAATDFVPWEKRELTETLFARHGTISPRHFTPSYGRWPPAGPPRPAPIPAFKPITSRRGLCQPLFRFPCAFLSSHSPNYPALFPAFVVKSRTQTILLARATLKSMRTSFRFLSPGLESFVGFCPHPSHCPLGVGSNPQNDAVPRLHNQRFFFRVCFLLLSFASNEDLRCFAFGRLLLFPFPPVVCPNAQLIFGFSSADPVIGPTLSSRSGGVPLPATVLLFSLCSTLSSFLNFRVFSSNDPERGLPSRAHDFPPRLSPRCGYRRPFSLPPTTQFRGIPAHSFRLDPPRLRQDLLFPPDPDEIA